MSSFPQFEYSVKMRAPLRARNGLVDLEEEPREVESTDGLTERSESPREVVATPLPLYLREIGAKPLLNGAEEVRLAKELKKARQAVARLADGLPRACRDHVLEGNSDGPKAASDWELSEIERFFTKLLRYAELRQDPILNRAAKKVRFLKRDLDRAREALIVANLRLVVHIAKRYKNCGIPLIDLIQEGNIGLMKAVEKFDHEMGNKFSTYAFWWIKQAIDRAISDKGRMIRLPVHLIEKKKKVARATRDLVRTLGRQPTPQEIASHLDMTVDKVQEILGLVADASSAQTASAEDRDLLESVRDPGASSPLEQAREQEVRDRIERGLESLDSRERRIIRLRFGLGANAAHTLEEIGSIVGLSRERVRQIEVIAIRKLQASRWLKQLVSETASA